jgi:mycobactin peptide synthetase MbtE
VAVTDNFFDIGGHSMAMVTVAARLSERLGRHVAVLDLFRYPVVRALAAYLDQDAGPGEELQRAARRAAQRRDRARIRSARMGKS